MNIDVSEGIHREFVNFVHVVNSFRVTFLSEINEGYVKTNDIFERNLGVRLQRLLKIRNEVIKDKS